MLIPSSQTYYNTGEVLMMVYGTAFYVPILWVLPVSYFTENSWSFKTCRASNWKNCRSFNCLPIIEQQERNWNWSLTYLNSSLQVHGQVFSLTPELYITLATWLISYVKFYLPIVMELIAIVTWHDLNIYIYLTVTSPMVGSWFHTSRSKVIEFRLLLSSKINYLNFCIVNNNTTPVLHHTQRIPVRSRNIENKLTKNVTRHH